MSIESSENISFPLQLGVSSNKNIYVFVAIFYEILDLS